MTNQTMQVQELKPQVDITTRPPLPPFTESAIQKVHLAEEADIRAKGMTVFGCIDHSAGKTGMSYDEPEFYHENIARYCSTHNYCSAGCSSR
jgi:hypothetical protein